jgi:biopolymer transport protein ExbB/TolQ
MGPALLSLADNDVAGLARSLALAFGATVVGLLVGLLRSVVGSVRRQWYAADLARFDAFVEGLRTAPAPEAAA